MKAMTVHGLGRFEKENVEWQEVVKCPNIILQKQGIKFNEQLGRSSPALDG